MLEGNRDKQRAKAARYRQSAKPRTCPRCGVVHTSGGSDCYCKECRRVIQREWRTQNRAKVNARQRAHYHANREKVRAAQDKRNKEVRREVLDAYGGVCACCGEHRIEFLSLDHINGDGKQHRQEAKEAGVSVGSSFYRWLRRQGFPQGQLRVLCHNCNMARGFYGYCPHNRE